MRKQKLLGVFIFCNSFAGGLSYFLVVVMKPLCEGVYLIHYYQTPNVLAFVLPAHIGY